MNDKNSGILSKITVEARTELIHDMLSDVASLFDRSEEKVGKLVEVLQQQKAAVGHGNWQRYLRENFGGDAAVQRIQHFMRKPEIAKKSLMTFLESNEEPDTAPRSERKTGQVEVVEPEEPGQTDVQTDDDPTPDPPTIRKTAKGSEKVKEADKPKTAAITPEILDDDPKEGPTDAVEAYLDVVSPVQVVRDVLTRITDDGVRVKEAKRIRKEMDKFDPPTKFRAPDLDEVTAFFTEQKATDPDSFFDFYESKGWLVGKVSMKSWQASARKWIRENESNGKANNNGRRTTETADPGSCLGPNGRPKVEHRKINYK